MHLLDDFGRRARQVFDDDVIHLYEDAGDRCKVLNA
jgi:hypothetical protein